MKKIGLLSDTHGHVDEAVFRFFESVDEIWHAGDIGTLDTVDTFSSFKPFRAVYGNIDDAKIRTVCPEHTVFEIEKVKVFMTHIGGYPGRYVKSIKPLLVNNKTKLFISGHSHILKVLFDKELHLLHINPGAAGRYGWHTSITLVRFDVQNGSIENLEIFEKKRNQ